MDILISVNDKYLDKAKSMLYSLSLNVKEEVTVYLLNSSLSNYKIKKFEAYLKKKCHIKLYNITVDKKFFEKFPVSRFSVEMYYRILAQFLLPSNLERILWLDADIIILNSLEQFYYQEFNDKWLVACQDINDVLGKMQKHKRQLCLAEEDIYFNSGVILFNLRALRENTCMSNIINQADKLKNSILYPDQDILNILYHNKVKYDTYEKYNFQTDLLEKIDKETEKKIVVLHYSGLYKPWNYILIMDISKYYWNIQLKRKRYLRYILACIMKKLRKLAFNTIFKSRIKYTKGTR